MNGWTRRSRRLAAALVVAAAVLGGCSTSGDGDGGEPTSITPATTSEEPFPTPTPEPTTTTPDPTTTDDDPVISLPRLPIGGEPVADPDEPDRQCVRVSFRAAIPDGYAIELRLAIDPWIHEVLDDTCGEPPSCVGHIYRSDTTTCWASLRALSTAQPGATSTLRPSGILYCPQPGSTPCRAFEDEILADSDQTAINLLPVPGATTSADTETTTSGTTTSATTSATSESTSETTSESDE